MDKVILKKPVNWAIIGLGKIANKFAQDLMLVDDAILYGVASRDMERSKSFAERYGSIKYFSSYEELVKDPQVDVVYIATPHVFHFANTMLCLKHNKAVLCEKPLAMNGRQVKAMIDEAKSKQLFLMEALWTRFIPATEKLLTLLRSNTIGEIECVKADFGFVGDVNPERRVFNRELGGGSLLDVGIYPVYLSLLLMGIPKTIKATAIMASTKVDSSCDIVFEYSGGQKAILESSIIANTPVEALIYGKKGTIKMHRNFHHSEKITITKNDNQSETISIKYRGNGYYHEIVDVMDCLRNKKVESDKMPHSMSMDLMNTLDRIRQEIGLTYPSDKE